MFVSCVQPVAMGSAVFCTVFFLISPQFLPFPTQCDAGQIVSGRLYNHKPKIADNCTMAMMQINIYFIFSYISCNSITNIDRVSSFSFKYLLNSTWPTRSISCSFSMAVTSCSTGHSSTRPVLQLIGHLINLNTHVSCKSLMLHEKMSPYL